MSTKITILQMPRQSEISHFDTAELRRNFLLADLFANGELRYQFTDLDRFVVGAAVPVATPLELANDKEAGNSYFLEKRELGAINVGGPGAMILNGKRFEAAPLDCVYAPKGTHSVVFESADEKNPARFFWLSCPAHQEFPAASLRHAESTPVVLGAQAGANSRTIYKYIHPGGIQSCQLVMGFTVLNEGSVWNTMPPHTHHRRSEVYFYFDLGSNAVVHLMGDPRQTRHLFVHNEQAVLSPSWSIHSGCGTAAYKFIWAMAGENQAFDDMDPAPALILR